MKIKVSPFLFSRKLSKYTDARLKSLEKKSIKKWNHLNLDRWEDEIFNSCIILKNMAIVEQNIPLSADYILEELRDNSKYLQGTYGKIISELRNGTGEEAFQILSDKVPTRAGKNFAYILSNLDKINPIQLVSTMTAFEETFSGQRMTKAMKKTEKKSIITTMMATASIFAILMNFAVVVVFMDTLKMLGQVF